VAAYPFGTRAADVVVPCPACSQETRVPWLRKYSGLEQHEQGHRMSHWRCSGFAGAPREWMDQRRAVLTAIEGMVDSPRGLHTLWGDFGSGKTFALQIAVNELRELRQVEGYYAPFSVILDHLRNLWANGQDSSSFWERLLNVPVLALDEVTRFDDSKQWAQEKLFNLVDTRYRRRGTHLTVFATNDNPNTVLSTDDPVGYLFSRMREGAMYLLEGDLRQAMSKKER